MGRSRSRSYSPRGDRGGREAAREPPTQCSLLVRNLSRSVTVEDLRHYAEKYGPLRDIYIPKNYYTKEPRGIAFIEYTSSRDCEDAKYSMDRMNIAGREVTVAYAQHGRKRPETFARDSSRGGSYDRGGGGGGGYDRGRGSDRDRDRGGRDRDRDRTRDRDRDYDDDRRRSRSRSRERSRSRDRSVSRDPSDDRERRRNRERSVSRSPAARKTSRSPSRGRSPAHDDRP